MTSEKLAPRSRSFREVFVQFVAFSDVFGSFRTRLDLFGCVRMCSDAIGCISVRWEAFHSGSFRIFLIFQTILVIFGCFGGWGAYFYGCFTFRGLTFIGANYWEVA